MLSCRHRSSLPELDEYDNDDGITVSSEESQTPIISGRGSLAVVMGGFGFTPRQLRKHTASYHEHDFDVLPYYSSLKQLATPAILWQRSQELASRLQAEDKDIVVHAISGSFWTALSTLAHLEPDWRERRVRGIVFDSAPPQHDVYAFGGWASWLLQRRLGVPPQYSKPLVSHLFHPVLPLCGIDETFAKKNYEMMFGETGCAVPRNACLLFLRGDDDPVLNPEYVDEWANFLRERSHASVVQRTFASTSHAMAVVSEPERYREVHAEDLLGRVPEWRPVSA